ncbi:hypothetical protein [Streptomyces sp. SID3212]|uniref:hypothetical protein n=1 Tax=Streptomyces sp. SID3212 TaxID=2690259 RepID=UPI00136BC3D5|nr:hypothetical protein [Streptomyces sp. SID3212]MYV58135.1 hypothetical protein [Streptomyces sp. SID3212]
MRGRLLGRSLDTAVARAGAPGRILFTERQLYYELCRVVRPVGWVPRALPFTPAPPVPYERFEEALARRRGEAPGLLGLLGPDPGPGFGAPGGGSPKSGVFPEPGAFPGSDVSPEPDLYDYGLPRLLVCQSRSVARMLLANDLHLEAACPVLAADDLPLDPRLLAGLARVEGATVHVLHDASVAGIALTARLRADHPGVRVASLGLVPRHAIAMRLNAARDPARSPGEAVLSAALPAVPPAALPAGLDRHEREWLARGRSAEVEAVHPARLLRTVQRLVRGPRTSDHSMWTGLRELRTTGFMTWPAN